MMAVLYSTSVLAAVDPYEALEVTPAEGVVTSLQHFTITFAGLPVEVNEQAIPSLEKGGGATIEGTMRAAEDGTTVLVDFDVCSTASGHYFLHLPEGSLKVNGQRLLPLTLRFSIEGDLESFYNQITVNPAEGDVESLQNFTISFPQYVGEINYGSKAILTNNTTGSTYEAEMYEVGFNVLVYFPNEIYEAGDYTLKIPAGSVIFYTMDETVRELNFNYTIADHGQALYDQITINPAEGHVQSLRDFIITFPELVNGIAPGSEATLTNTTTGATYQAAMGAYGYDVTVNFGQDITADGRYVLSIPAASVITNSFGNNMHELRFNYTIATGDMPSCTINPPEGELYRLQNFTIDYEPDVIVDENALAILSNDDTGTAYECNFIEIGGNAFIYMNYPLDIVGHYTLHVPAGSIEVAATGVTNPQMEFHYTVIEKDTYVPPVIEDQPEGELRIYNRSGGVIREVEKPYTVEEGESPYEIIQEQQEGSLSIVFAPDNKVYIERPVSWSYYDGWVEGTLSDDGKTITVPMGQYVAYTKSLEMAVQVGVFVYDEDRGSYFYDESIDELTYTINDDGSISQNDTDPYIILGTMNRAFGDQFQYLDYEWLQAGDYGSVYTLAAEQPIAPPADLVTENYYLTTANFDGMEWEPYTATVAMGFDGDDVWLQGVSQYLPSAWIKGTRNGSTITFPNTQLLGAYDVLLYFKCASLDLVTGNTTEKDMVLTMSDENTWYTYDYVFISADKNSLYYINYYQGLTISKYPNMPLQVPEDLETEPYIFKYTTVVDNKDVEAELEVELGIHNNEVYIRGIWEYLPDAWVKGRIVGGRMVLDLPQYIGDYKEEYSITYPMYLVGFNAQTGVIQRQVKFDYNQTTGVFSNPTHPIGIGINKTGYLNLLDYYDAELTPVNTPSKLGDVNRDGRVNISDVTVLITYLLTGSAGDIDLVAADVTLNDEVNISDVTTLITMIMSGN